MSILSRVAVAASGLPLDVKKFMRGLLLVNTVAAAGSAATDATALTAGKNLVTASDGTKGVILPAAEADMEVRVTNTVAGSNLLVYPNTGAQINALTATTGAFTVPGGNEAIFYCDVTGSSGHWYVAAGGTEAFDNLTMTNPIVYDHNTTITAFATGGQASAVALTGEFNNVTTCATAGDSVKLLAAALGQKQTVKNSGVAALAVFPFSGDSINAMAVNLSIDIPPNGQMVFHAISATVWETDEMLVSQAPTTQKGSLVVKAADSAGNTVTTLTNASQAAARTYTIPDAGADASYVMTEGTQTINGAKTFGGTVAHGVQSVTRTGLQRIINTGAKLGAGAGWTLGGGAVNTGLMATMAASQTAGTLVVPIPGLKVGDTITAFSLVGQIESAGGIATLDADLRKHTAAAADVTDASVGAIVQISVTADAIVSAAKSALAEVVAADETFYVLLTGTTAAATDLALQGITITVSEV